jgi:DNA (cytosine-5)-methyltransferase 1
MRLLPTPLTTDAQGAGGHGDGGRDLRTTVVQDWDTEAWAEYLPAILRWCKITNGAPPVPVEPNSNGNLRIAARFSEWMMGWPSGWVTSMITTNRKLMREDMISRTAGMRMIGNGVVPQQAIMAIDALMEEW